MPNSGYDDGAPLRTLIVRVAGVNWIANDYRLPTKAEWEKTVRGGSTSQEYPWSNAAAGLRCAARSSLASASSNTVVGLRCVRR